MQYDVIAYSTANIEGHKQVLLSEQVSYVILYCAWFQIVDLLWTWS